MRIALLILIAATLASCTQATNETAKTDHQPHPDCCGIKDSLELKLSELKSASEPQLDFYLSIDQMLTADPWTGVKTGRRFFYRVIVSSVEESRYLHGELLEVIGDGKVKEIARKEVPASTLGLEYLNAMPVLKRWKSYHEIELSVNEEVFTLDVAPLLKAE
jgi:hypothetical protein